MTTQYATATEIRSMFSTGLSAIYRAEVPSYADLIALVSEVNSLTLDLNPELRKRLRDTNQLGRLQVERHGAIRLGTTRELFIMARFLRIMGMRPVGYYDLTKAGLPVQATCFRATELESLSENPFRLFVSLLHQPLLSTDLQGQVQDILSRRELFHPRVLDLIAFAEANNFQLTSSQARDLVEHGLSTFKWRSTATVSIAEYSKLHDASPLLADIVSFPGPHINHLTPRTLDIDLAETLMRARGFPTKETIEGPPRRKCPILLRQTSFKALEEAVGFRSQDGLTTFRGTHTARFGEIEQRGAALTPEGRRLYDSIIETCARSGISPSQEEAYARAFLGFPDNWELLRRRRLCWFRYFLTEKADTKLIQPSELHLVEYFPESLDQLIDIGWVDFEPITYEDFLPLSAAGIFHSNLNQKAYSNDRETTLEVTSGDLDGLVSVLQGCIEDEMSSYAMLQKESLRRCEEALRKLTCNVSLW